MVEDNQRGILSPSYEPDPLSNDHEAGIVQVHMVHSGGISDEDIAEGHILARCSRPIGSVSLDI